MVDADQQAVSPAHGSESVKKPSSCDCMPAANGRATAVITTQKKPDKASVTLVKGVCLCVGGRACCALCVHAPIMLSLQCLLSVFMHPFHEFLLYARYCVSVFDRLHDLVV